MKQIIHSLKVLVLFVFGGYVAQNAMAQNAMAQNANSNQLKTSLQKIITPYKAKVGVAIMHMEKRDTLTINNKQKYPMQSVYKFPLALAVLNLVDRKELQLEQLMYIMPSDLRTNTWSPMRDEHPNGDFEISVAKLIEYAITVSDNNACDLLFDLIGGTAALEQFLEDKNIENMSIKANDVEKSKGFEVQYKNNCTPYACIELLDGLFHNMIVSKESSSFLYKTMESTTTGPNRIRGKLSKNVTVAHKTGSGDTNKEGMTAAINDVGIVTLQNGNHVAISVLVSDSYETMETSELIIAKIAKEVVKFYEN